LQLLQRRFTDDSSDRFHRIKSLLSTYAATATLQPAVHIGLIAAAIDIPLDSLVVLIRTDLSEILEILPPPVPLASNRLASNSLDADRMDPKSVLSLREPHQDLLKWICSPAYCRLGQEFWVDVATGHNTLCALYLKFCANKSVAVECPWQDYLRTYGPTRKYYYLPISD
jgi:hypothetical protein